MRYLIQDCERQIRFKFHRQNTSIFNHFFVNTFDLKKEMGLINSKIILLKIASISHIYKENESKRFGKN